MGIEHWPARWEGLRVACAKRHATDHHCDDGESRPPRFVVGPPARKAELAAIERKLGLALPSSFRDVVLRYSAEVDIAWQLPDDVKLPKPLWDISAGECRWSLSKLPALQVTYRKWVEECFQDPNNPYDAIWHNKLAIHEVGDGDMVAIDCAEPGSEPVVHLSHDGGEEHGYWLGANFEDYVDRLSQLGCVGAESFQWKNFVKGPRSLLDPSCANARSWRKWFGLQWADAQ